MRMGRQFQTDAHYEVARDGVMIGWLHGHTVSPGAPGYETNRDFFETDGGVLREERRQGVGTALLKAVLAQLDRHGCRILNLWTEEDSGHAFVQWTGAERKFNAAENRLQLGEVDWAMVRSWIEDGEARSPETRLEIYDGPIPEPMRDEYAAQLTVLLNTIPFEDLDHGEIVVTPEQMADWFARQAATQTTEHTVVAREPDGAISGITDVSWTEHLPTFVEQLFTGVRPDTRGRGIGKWIKAAMLEKIRREYPQVTSVITGNATSNDPMLSINHRLGFKQFRAGSEYQISRDRLAERLREL